MVKTGALNGILRTPHKPINRIPGGYQFKAIGSIDRCNSPSPEPSPHALRAFPSEWTQPGEALGEKLCRPPGPAVVVWKTTHFVLVILFFIFYRGGPKSKHTHLAFTFRNMEAISRNRGLMP